VTELGRPVDPEDPRDERSFIVNVPAKVLEGIPGIPGTVGLDAREGVFAHSFKCLECGLHFVLFSWAERRLNPDTIACPECGRGGRFMHRVTVLSRERRFGAAETEIYQVWPFRTAPPS
jgi:DNA-directed RNA polymerase subunit RPC12/RpoP